MAGQCSTSARVGQGPSVSDPVSDPVNFNPSDACKFEASARMMLLRLCAARLSHGRLIHSLPGESKRQVKTLSQPQRRWAAGRQRDVGAL